MDENETAALLKDQRALLKRFDNQIQWVCWSVSRSFGLPGHGLNVDDLREEAKVLVLTYAGQNAESSDGSNRLAGWVKETEGDEVRIKHLLGKQLRIDLSRIISRYIGKEKEHTSIDKPVYRDVLVGFDLEDQIIDKVEKEQEAKRLRRGFPTLARNILDGFTQVEIAQELGVGHATVERRIAKEKRAYLIDYVTRHGLRVEGDETIEELQEAYENLSEGK